MRRGKQERRAGAIPGLSLIAVVLFSISTLFFSWKIVEHLLDAHKSQSYWDGLQDSVVVINTTEPEEKPTPLPEVEAPPVEEPAQEEPRIPEAIDFDSLRAVSEDAVAWLFSPDTKINYAVAQSRDNAYYLRRLLDGRAASGGSLFADYRCSADFSDWNTVIYGHYMKNGTMFGELKYYSDPAYYEEHPVMYLYVPEKRYRLEVISGYTTDIYDIAYSVPASKEQRDTLLAQAIEKSSFQSGVTVEEEDRLVTLSTCSYAYDNARYIVISRIVEK